MPDDPGIPAVTARPERASRDRVIAFAQAASLEVTQPTPAEIEEIASILPAGTEIFISDIPRRSFADAAQACALLTATGLVPVPHIAVRRMESAAALEQLIGDCTDRGGARKVMLVAGDYDVPAGPYGDVAAVLEACALQRFGIREVFVAGYPEGHPRISTAVLKDALERKRDLLRAQGIGERVVTQFGFDGDAMVRFILLLRQNGIHSPVLVGMAGPATAKTLARFAIRCGVRTVSRHLVRNGSRISGSLLNDGPEQLLRQLSDVDEDGHVGDIRPHFFSFGGGVPTARWIRAVQDENFAAPSV
jgi:methylenetetrahydrofolate reductase (NADPH)